MARVMIVCPETEQPVYTHVSCTASDFMDLPIIQSTIKCVECGKQHSWTPADSYLDEEGGGD